MTFVGNMQITANYENKNFRHLKVSQILFKKA